MYTKSYLKRSTDDGIKEFLKRFVVHLIGASFFGARRSYLGIAAIFTRPDSGLDSGTTLLLKGAEHSCSRLECKVGILQTTSAL